MRDLSLGARLVSSTRGRTRSGPPALRGFPETPVLAADAGIELFGQLRRELQDQVLDVGQVAVSTSTQN